VIDVDRFQFTVEEIERTRLKTPAVRLKVPDFHSDDPDAADAIVEEDR
jgi:hypothetical protein